MKAKLALLCGFLLLVSIAQAAVFVTQDGKTTQYKDGATIETESDKEVVVNYNGVKITVPANTAVQIAQDKNGNITVKGNDLSNVKIGQNVVSSTGETVFVVSTKNNAITVKEGTLYVRDEAGKVSALKKGEVSADTVPAFVSEAALAENTVAQQAVQNIAEEAVLSPSAPRY